jgi:hypothetical protein
MAIEFYYPVVSVKNARWLSKNYFAADVQCETEHGHLLAEQKNVLCSKTGFANHEDAEEVPQEILDTLGPKPPYYVYDEEKFWKMAQVSMQET